MFFLINNLESEIECLKQMYTQLDGDNWKDNTNWRGADHCAFYGISCDVNNKVVKIELAKNKLKGKLPTCFNNEFSELSTLSMSINEIFGLYTPHEKLKSIQLSQTLLDIEIEKLENVSTLTALYLDLVKLPNRTFPSKLLNQLTSLKLFGCNLKASPAEIKNSPIEILNIVSNNFSSVKLEVDSEKIEMLYISNSHITMEVNASELACSEIMGTGSNLKIVGNINKIKSLDCSGCEIENLTSIHQVNPERMQILNLANSNLVGFAPNVEDAENIRKKGNLYYNVAYNPLFCKPGETSTVPCTQIQIFNVERLDNELIILMGSSFDVPTLPFEHIDLKLTYKNALKQDTPMNCTYTVSQTHSYKAFCADIPAGVEPKNEEINAFYENISVIKSGSYESKVEPKTSERNINKDSAKQLLTLEVTGLSMCPYYTMFMKMCYYPFAEKYQKLSKLIRYNYSSIIIGDSSLVSEGYTMHGAAEAFEDSVKICLEDITTNEIFVEFEFCAVNQNWKAGHVYTCLDEIELTDETLECVEERAAELSKYHSGRYRYLASAGSPELYIKDRFLDEFDWSTGSIDTLAEIFCSYDELKNTPECKEI